MKTMFSFFVLLLVIGCVGAQPTANDVGNGGYYPPPSDTYQPPPDEGGSDSTDATDGAEDTYQPPKEDTAQADTSTGPQEGDPCDDGNQCTGSDCWHDGACVGKDISSECDKGVAGYKYWCDPETGCQSAKEQVECKDNVPCTLDVIEGGVCKHKPVAAECEDGDKCTTNACKADVGCVTTATIDCADGLACTDNTCDPTTGQCDSVLNCADNEYCSPTTGNCELSDDGVPDDGTGCNDGNACTIADRYTGGVCKGSTISCADGKSCTTDSCNPATGCSNVQKSCGDGMACTTDWCSETLGCVNEENCDDGKPTTTDSCNASGECVHTPIVTGPQVGDACNDSDSCTVNDKIVAGGACVGSAMNCNDGKTCTADSCVSGQCKNVPTCTCTVGGGCASDPAPVSHIQFRIQIDYPDAETAALNQVKIEGEHCESTAIPNYTNPALNGMEGCNLNQGGWGEFKDTQSGKPTSWMGTELSNGFVEVKPVSKDGVEMFVFHVFYRTNANQGVEQSIVPWEENGVEYSGTVPLLNGWTVKVWADGVAAKCELRYNYWKNGTNLWCVPAGYSLPPN